jgi:hypothetical protein
VKALPVSFTLPICATHRATRFAHCIVWVDPLLVHRFYNFQRVITA